MNLEQRKSPTEDIVVRWKSAMERDLFTLPYVGKSSGRFQWNSLAGPRNWEVFCAEWLHELLGGVWEGFNCGRPDFGSILYVRALW